MIALQITHLVVKNFVKLNHPLTASEIATRLVIPIAIIQSVLSNLIIGHIIVEYIDRDETESEEIYQPAVDINILTIAYVINALEYCGQNHLPDINQERLFVRAVNDFKNLMESSEQNCLLKDI
jgi:membrane protein